MKNRPIYLPLIVLLIGLAVPAAGFSAPAPDEKLVEAERKLLEDRRAAVGDDVFFHELTVKLNLLCSALPKGHPLYGERAMQEGTAEFFVTTRPFFAKFALEMLKEAESEAAFEAVTRVLELKKHQEVDFRSSNFAQYFSFIEYAHAQATWLVMAVEHLGLNEALMKVAMDDERSGFDLAGLDQVDLRLGFEEEHGLIWRLSWEMESGNNSAIYILRGLVWSEKVLLPVWDEAREAQEGRPLTGERWEFQAAVALVSFRDAQRLTDEPEARALRLTTYECVLRRLLAERDLQKSQPKRRDWDRSMKQLARLIGVLTVQADDVSKYPDSIRSLLVAAAEHGRWYSLLDNHFDGEVPLTDDELEQLGAVLVDPLVHVEVRRQMADLFLRKRYAPAGRRIVAALNDAQMMEELYLHPRYTADPPDVAYESWARFLLDVIWLRHTVQSQPQVAGGGRW